jgi:hypothetical protein
MGTPDKPIGVAIVICDRVITDARTNEKTLVATFNRITARNFPCVHPRISIFVAVTGGKGSTNAQIRCVNESTNELAFESSGMINFADPNHVVEMNFELKNIAFPKPGLHGVEFLCEGELILQRRFEVVHLTEGSKR